MQKIQHPRKKSCTQCRDAKTRCTLDFPACSRCLKKGIGCHYEVLPRRSNVDTIPNIISPSGFSNPAVVIDTSKPATADRNNGGLNRPDTSHGAASCAVPVFVPTLFYSWLLETKQTSISARDVCSAYCAEQHKHSGSWIFDSVGNCDAPLIQIREPGSTDKEVSSLMEWTQDPPNTSTPPQSSFTHTPSPSHPSKQGNTTTLTPPTQTTLLTNNELKNRMTTPLSFPTSKFHLSRWDVLKHIPANTSRLLRRRPVSKLSSLLQGNLLQSKFESYVFAFDEGVLPPFVHFSVVRPVDENGDGDGNGDGNGDGGKEPLPEALRNCRTILPMYFGGEKACKALVNKTMMLEVQRIHDEYHTYDQDALLHSLQALIIYLIILAHDTERYDLVSIVTHITINEIAKRIHQKAYLFLEPNYAVPSWEEWVREESKARTILLLHLLIRLVDTDIMDSTRSPCPVAFINVPLPCSKKLWEAGTRVAWAAEYKSYLAGRKGTRRLRVGDLKKAIECEVGEMEGEVESDLEDWSRKVDGFGGMLLSCELLGK